MGLKGGDKHVRRLRKLSGPDLTRLIDAVLYEGADGIKAEAQRSITAGSVSGKNHVPSAPGEPPNNDTGVLKGNISATLTGVHKAEVRSQAPYAAALEWGTSKMAARPYMRPARDKLKDKIQARLAEQFAKLVQRSG